MPERLRHVVDARELDPSWLRDVFDQIQGLKTTPSNANDDNSKMVYISFHDRSDITKAAFAAAIQRLGWKSFDRGIPAQSMWEVGHEVTIACWQGYDVIVLRSSEPGGVKRAAANSSVPVINAGEGFNGSELLNFPQHTSQGITDASTIREKLGLGRLRITLVGDVRNNPVVNALLCTLANLGGVEIAIKSNGVTGGLHRDVEKFLTEKRIPLIKQGSDNFQSGLRKTDVLYIAHSLHTKTGNLPPTYRHPLTTEDLSLLPSHAVIMHDMTRGMLPEEDSPIQTDPRLVHKTQVENGVYGNMAILRSVISR